MKFSSADGWIDKQMEPIPKWNVKGGGWYRRDWWVTIPNLFHCIIHATLIKFSVMGHVWNITRWGLELNYKLQASQMCRSAFQYDKWEILNIWARSWYYQKNSRQELKTATVPAALKHPRKKPVLEQVSPTILASPIIKERMTCMWESKIALMEF